MAVRRRHLIAPLAALLSLAWLTGCQRSPSADVPVITERLANGLRVILTPDAEAADVVIGVWYTIGSRREPRDRNGLAHVAEHVYLLGPGAGLEQSSTPHDKGLFDVFGSTNYDRTRFMSTIKPAALDGVLEVEAARMADPPSAATEDHVRQGAGEVLDEIDRKRRQPDALLRNLVAAHSVPPGAASYGLPVGERDAVTRLTAADVQRWLARHYGPRHAVLVLAGAFDPASALATIRSRFGGIVDRSSSDEIDDASTPEGEDRPAQVALEGAADRAYAIWNLPGVAAFDSWAIDLVRHLVRDEVEAVAVRGDRSATFVSATLSAHQTFGQLQFEIGPASPARAAALLDIVKAEVRRIAAGRIAARAVARVVRDVTDEFHRELAGKDRLAFKANLLADGAVFHGDPQYHLRELARIGKIDVTALADAVNRSLSRAPIEIVVSSATASVERPHASASNAVHP